MTRILALRNWAFRNTDGGASRNRVEATFACSCAPAGAMPRIRQVVAASRLLLCVLLPASGQARTWLACMLTAADGLPTDHVRALAQDPIGLPWIGTAGGLARYDGRSLQPWGADLLDIRAERLSVAGSGEIVLQDCPGEPGGLRRRLWHRWSWRCTSQPARPSPLRSTAAMAASG